MDNAHSNETAKRTEQGHILEDNRYSLSSLDRTEFDIILTILYNVNILYTVYYCSIGVIIMIIQVCIGSACHLKGAYNVINKLQSLISEKGLQDRVTLKAAFCLGQCTSAVSVQIDDGPVLSVSDSSAEQFFDECVAGRL